MTTFFIIYALVGLALAAPLMAMLVGLVIRGWEWVSMSNKKWHSSGKWP